MSLRIEDINTWTAERIADALPSIITCAKRVVAEHPHQLTLASLFHAVMSGQTVLWIVSDDKRPAEAVLAVFTTLRHYEATGVAFIEITGIAGMDINEALPLLDVIEAWGADHGAYLSSVHGRPGWERLLKPRGYTKQTVTLTKQFQSVEGE